MSDNIYAAPQANLTQTSNDDKDDVTLATRWSRLWSSLIDSLTIMAVSIPTMYFTGGLELIIQGIQPSFIYNISIAALSITVFFIINFKLLKNQGQTIGKKILKIKIIDLNGNLPDFNTQILKRYATYFLPGQIPVAGQIFSLINILFIFGKKKRCIHDFVAATKVIKA